MKKSKELRTEQRIEQYGGKSALLETWEQTSDEVQIANHDYIRGLKARVRSVRNYIVHRSDPDAKV